MIAILGLSIAITMPRFPASKFSRMTIAQGDVLDKVIPVFDVADLDFRKALKELFSIASVKFAIEPGLEGKVTLNMRNAKFELVLQNICSQANVTYRYEFKTFMIIARDNSIISDPAPRQPLPKYDAKGATSSYPIRNSRPFLTPRRTKGGTYDLLNEALSVAGFYPYGVCSYGESGFALVLPIETIDKEGHALPDNFRFRFNQPKNVWNGPDEVQRTISDRIVGPDHDFRLIVLTISDDQKKSRSRAFEAVMKEYEGSGISWYDRRQMWSGNLKLKAYTYEFRRQKGSRLATLLKPGQSKISARRHLVLSGLWSEKELGN